MRYFFILCFTYFVSITNLCGQCAMCTLNAEGSSDSQANAINTGILYMLLFPLVIIIVIGFFLWWNREKLFKSNSNDKVS